MQVERKRCHRWKLAFILSHFYTVCGVQKYHFSVNEFHQGCTVLDAFFYYKASFVYLNRGLWRKQCVYVCVCVCACAYTHMYVMRACVQCQV